MSFDGIITGAIATELASHIIGGKIEKIYQPESDELVFHIHARGANYKLYASCNSNHARIHFIQENRENPPAPLSFCMLLRKHLQGGRILEVRQMNSERIIEIEIDTKNELGFSVHKKLIIEIMGKHSNIILTDAESGKIIDSIKRISIDVNRFRQLLPGKIYQYPPDQGKIPFRSLTEGQLSQLMEKSSLLSKMTPHLEEENIPPILVSGIQGISLPLARALTQRTFKEFSACESPVPLLFKEIEMLRDHMLQGTGTPLVHLLHGTQPLDFHILPLMEESPEISIRSFETLSMALEFYYANRDSSNRVRQKAGDLEKNLKNILQKLYLKKQRLQEDLFTAENSEKYRLFGELLTANLHAVKGGDTSVTLINYYDGEALQVPLDKRLSPSKNAQQYFKKYSKAKIAVKEKKNQLEELDQDILYVESVGEFLDSALTLEDVEALRFELSESGYLKRRKAPGKSSKKKAGSWSYASGEGLKILAGRNNMDNDHLTFKLAGAKDLWFHAKDLAGSHVILFTEGKEASENSIREAASIAAFHSKGKHSDNVPVDYTRVRYVKKPKGARPGMVIFTENRTVYVSPRIPEEIKEKA